LETNYRINKIESIAPEGNICHSFHSRRRDRAYRYWIGGICRRCLRRYRENIEYLVTKLVNLRIFSDTSGKFNLSLLDVKGELLLVSQFTLLADARHGRRPGFTDAAAPPEAERLFNTFVDRAKASGSKVVTGKFQEYMQVEIHNDGPVTIMLDSHDKMVSQTA
jgi:D-tyrosyl-tRNA(Tyr) deacylase